MNRFAAAFSQHPVAAHAVGEVAGAVFDSLGVSPDVVAIFVTAPFTGTLEDIAAALQKLLEPRVMIGATAVAVLANGVEIEEGPAVAVWAAKLGDSVRSVRITADQTDDGWAFDGLNASGVGPPPVVLVGDPYTFPTEEFLATVAESRPDLPVIGGMASAARGPGGNRLIVDGVVTTHGAVGFVVGDAGEPETVVSQGCRPIGQPYTVTRAERNMIYELGGQPALERLMAMVDALVVGRAGPRRSRSALRRRHRRASGRFRRRRLPRAQCARRRSRQRRRGGRCRRPRRGHRAVPSP